MTCAATGKIGYEHPAEAAEHCRSLNAGRRGRRLTVYRCGRCGLYHAGRLVESSAPPLDAEDRLREPGTGRVSVRLLSLAVLAEAGGLN